MATVVLAVGMAGLLPAIVGAVRTTRAARDASQAASLAWQKVEQLRLPVDLAVSPADALAVDTAGYVEYLDEHGTPGVPPGVYTRRWHVEAAGDPAAGALRLAVSVFHAVSPASPVVIATVRRRGRP